MTAGSKKPLDWPVERLPSAITTFCRKTADIIAALPVGDFESGREAEFAAWLSPADEYGVWMQTRQAGQLRPFDAGQVAKLCERGASEIAVQHLLRDPDFELSIAELGHVAVLGREGLEPGVRQKRVFTQADDQGRRTEFIPVQHVAQSLDRICTIWNEASHETPDVFTALWIWVAITNAHPFQDGNGRLGRALMNAYLIRTGLNRHGPIPFGALKYAAQGNFEAAVRYMEATGDWLPLVKVFNVLIGSYSILFERFQRANEKSLAEPRQAMELKVGVRK